MKIWSNIYDALKRKTNSGSFIAPIDGLRFLAILLVVLDHINIFVAVKDARLSGDPAHSFLYHIIDMGGRKGVLLFFVISGFILALPFARQYLQSGAPVKLKDYFLRRLTRLEPPYFFCMIAVTFLLLWFGDHGFAAQFPKTFSGLLPGLAASLVYMHNIIFPNVPSVNQVAWSLEVEVQFYILVPLLVHIFKLPKAVRRFSLVALIAAATLAAQLFPAPIITIYGFIQYFLLGFLLADLYLDETRRGMGTALAVCGGAVSLAGILFMNELAGGPAEYAFLGLLFLFVYLVLMERVWQKIFSVRWMTAIGGMCYSIYLWHDTFMSAVGNHTIALNFSHSYPAVLLWQCALILPAVLLFSAFLYLLIEKPCMDKNWPVKLFAHTKALSSRIALRLSGIFSR